MDSDAALRIYRLAQHLHQPMPTFSDDDYINLAVTEAVMFRGLKDEQRQAKQQEVKAWKKRGYKGEDA